MKRYMDQVITPYVEKNKEKLKTEAKPLLIFDAYAADDVCAKIAEIKINKGIRS